MLLIRTEQYMTGNNEAKKYLIIHGHFYQPPRENPWINMIETQASAAPHHDWNERIYDQCYRPNAYSRLLDSDGMIVDICNNYLKLNFNFGPTLFAWLQQNHPVTAEQIIQADAQSCRDLEGHGNAIAQVFNHMIMPLSSRRDQLTQIRWAKHFFKNTFGRDPEGIWLAETAINMETVQCLIEENIKFVVLSPNQVDAFRPMHDNASWTYTSNSQLDTRRAYRIFPRTQSGEKLPGYLDAFFFNEGLSKDISFGDILTDSHILAERIQKCYDGREPNQTVVIASDGETFGHHKPFGDMCLAYFFKELAKKEGIYPVNFGYYLAKNPPSFEVSLKNAFGEGTAWSCAHGVGRWIRDCGCKTGGEPSWKQAWRTPFRNALEKLRDNIDLEYENAFRSITSDPWGLRDKYISVINEKSWVKFKEFIEANTSSGNIQKEQAFALRRLLEAQKFMMYSFTSCGWFFSDISGLESMQNLAYALRALQLGLPESKQEKILEAFLCDLERAKSNLPGMNGRTLFERNILSYYDHEKMFVFTAAIMRALDIKNINRFEFYGYDVELEPLLENSFNNLQLSGYKVALENESTGERSEWSVLVSYRDRIDLRGWVIPIANFTNAPQLRPEHWMAAVDAKMYTFADIFKASQQELTEHFLRKISTDTDLRFDAWAQQNARELDILSHVKSPLPDYCIAPLSFVFHEQWKKAIKKMESEGSEDEIFTELLDLHKTMARYNIPLDLKECALILEKLLVSELGKLSKGLDANVCDRIRYMLNLVDRFKIPVYKNRFEDIFHPILKEHIHNLYIELKTGNPGTYATMDESLDKKTLLIKLINFARRMNFNTEAFRISELISEHVHAAN
jgi:hypothetical protein